MDKRIIAIQFENDNNRQNAIQLVKSFIDYNVDCRLIVFKKHGLDGIALDGIEEIDLPSDRDSNSKIKNSIFDFAKGISYRGFLHIVEDQVQILKDPTTYIQQIENTMDVFDYNYWFSTTTDACNYLFKKFNPRVTINIDDQDIAQKLNLPNALLFTSHSNLSWTIYDFEKTQGNPQRYDEQFTIAMFQIIEYFARRRATKKEDQLYYMNQYLTIDSELGVFKSLDTNNANQIDRMKMQEEDIIFRNMRLDITPDNNIDVILDSVYQKLKEKLAGK